jgi:hypothetical protein
MKECKIRHPFIFLDFMSEYSPMVYVRDVFVVRRHASTFPYQDQKAVPFGKRTRESWVRGTSYCSQTPFFHFGHADGTAYAVDAGVAGADEDAGEGAVDEVDELDERLM